MPCGDAEVIDEQHLSPYQTCWLPYDIVPPSSVWDKSVWPAAMVKAWCCIITTNSTTQIYKTNTVNTLSNGYRPCRSGEGHALPVSKTLEEGSAGNSDGHRNTDTGLLSSPLADDRLSNHEHTAQHNSVPPENEPICSQASSNAPQAHNVHAKHRSQGKKLHP